MIDHSNYQDYNSAFAKAEPSKIIDTVLEQAHKPIVTTNFRPYEVAILHAVASVDPNVPVVWCDTGYNTPQTYRHAIEVIEKLGLDVSTYVPQQTVSYRNETLGIPTVDDSNHAEFTRQVKLEPFQRAMAHFQPDVWFTNLRAGQTNFRDSIDVLSYSKDGVLKVSPFYHYDDQQLDEYLAKHDLPNEFKYFDPTKVESNRECGLHA
ncbi:phosphoadenosine phosphosulfate reductase domain-containing protein [Nonlabens ponticola]|uniref:Phosphoadenylylsulfate reductase n=1 Tax=Nonlabens ponticola TaxID=2496866 RepID=A0A3S9MWN0_9FLAO|nr:phosphoadenosine phosphosulfate reductase family protein [Nonlabens ponticola]AZQ43552.1 phosphoadenylylsulfate reductase [Nonlabens ponticola]